MLLFQSRTIVLAGTLDQDLASRAAAELLALAGDSPGDITIRLSARGDDFAAAEMLHGTIRALEPRVVMVAAGEVAGAAVLVYVAAPRADRHALPGARFVLAQPTGRADGRAGELEAQVREIVRWHDRIHQLLADATGQPFERVEEDARRRRALTAEEAEQYGLVGRIVGR
jgi:ATP-dependent Clp protease protease subunit